MVMTFLVIMHMPELNRGNHTTVVGNGSIQKEIYEEII